MDVVSVKYKPVALSILFTVTMNLTENPEEPLRPLRSFAQLPSACYS